MDQYLDYAQGHNLTNHMPLFVKPTRKLSVNDTMNAMRDHFEDTWFDFRSDVGAQAFGMPYRWRPLDWNNKGEHYTNERATGTQQTGFTFVAQGRSWLPAPISGILWFGVDDAATAVYAPMYGGMTRVPAEYDTKDGYAQMMEFRFDSAFYVFNMVANFAYLRYSVMYPEIAQMIAAYENKYFTEVKAVDDKAAALYKKDVNASLEFITTYSVGTGSELVTEWLEYWKYLFVKYLDGNVKVKGTARVPSVSWPGYPTATYDRIVAETGDRYKYPKSKADANEAVSKRGQRLKGM